MPVLLPTQESLPVSLAALDVPIQQINALLATGANPFPHVKKGEDPLTNLSWILTGVDRDGNYMQQPFLYDCVRTTSTRAKCLAEKLDELDTVPYDYKAPPPKRPHVFACGIGATGVLGSWCLGVGRVQVR